MLIDEDREGTHISQDNFKCISAHCTLHRVRNVGRRDNCLRPRLVEVYSIAEICHGVLRNLDCLAAEDSH